jgi:hypothetical protein
MPYYFFLIDSMETISKKKEGKGKGLPVLTRI